MSNQTPTPEPESRLPSVARRWRLSVAAAAVVVVPGITGCSVSIPDRLSSNSATTAIDEAWAETVADVPTLISVDVLRIRFAEDHDKPAWCVEADTQTSDDLHWAHGRHWWIVVDDGGLSASPTALSSYPTYWEVAFSLSVGEMGG